MDVKQAISHAFGWSNNEHNEKPGAYMVGVKLSLDLIPAIKEVIKERKLQGDDLLVFYWWMGVVLGVIPSQLK